MSEVDQLRVYAEIEGSELGEYCCNLLCLREYNTCHGMGEEFNIELDKEISEQLKMFKEYSTVIEETEVTRTTRKILEWSE